MRRAREEAVGSGTMVRLSREQARTSVPVLTRELMAKRSEAVVARQPQKAERAILVLIDGAREDIEQVLASRRKLPSVSAPAQRLKGRAVAELKEKMR